VWCCSRRGGGGRAGGAAPPPPTGTPRLWAPICVWYVLTDCSCFSLCICLMLCRSDTTCSTFHNIPSGMDICYKICLWQPRTGSACSHHCSSWQYGAGLDVQNSRNVSMYSRSRSLGPSQNYTALDDQTDHERVFRTVLRKCPHHCYMYKSVLKKSLKIQHDGEISLIQLNY
jgi:hypothetical protein